MAQSIFQASSVAWLLKQAHETIIIKKKKKTDRIRWGKNTVDKGKPEFRSFLVEMSGHRLSPLNNGK